MRVPFGEWLPDFSVLGNPGIPYVKNVVPYQGSYLPLRSVGQITDAINARARGAYTAKSKEGTVYGYTGNETKLYSVSQAAHTDVTNTGGAYALGSESNWNFTKWGETIIAVAIEENPQVITFGGTNFADLAGSPPKAKHITVVNNFVVLANVNDGTARPQRVVWSGINDSTDWTQDAATQSDFQDLFSEANQGGGEIQGLIGGEYLTVIQEFSVWRAEYVGSPLIFEFREVLPGIGTPCKNSIVSEGRISHFVGQDGFYELIDGTSVSPIGKNKVDKFFFDDLDEDYYHRVVGAQDPANQLVAWIYPGAGNTSGTPNKIIIYDWFNKKWGYGEITLEWIYNSLGSGFTLEELDDVNSSIDAISPSLDARVWKGGALEFAVYDSDNKKGAFGGTALDATIETAEFELSEGTRSHLTGVRPLVDGLDVSTSVQIGTRNLQSNEEFFTDPVSPESTTGIAHFRSDNRYHRIRVNTSGDFTHALGVDVFGQPSGKR